MPPKKSLSNPARPIENLLLTNITVVGGVQSRLELSEAAVSRYTEYYQDDPDNDRVLPPISVRVHQGSYVLADGFHRFEAAKRAGRTYLPAYVSPGDLHDAWWDGVKANGATGVKYTGQDLRQILYTIFAHPHDSQLSDRAIAKLVGCSNVYVSRLHAEYNQPEEGVNQGVNQLTPPEDGVLTEAQQATERRRARHKAAKRMQEGLTMLQGLLAEDPALRATLEPYVTAAREAFTRLQTALALTKAATQDARDGDDEQDADD